MPTGVTRILPFAVISVALHAAVLMNTPERLEIAVTPGGDTGPVSVRLVPSGATTPDPAARSGVAGSVPAPPRQQSRPSEPATTTGTADRAVVNESPKPPQPDATEPDRVQAAVADRISTEAPPPDTDRERATAPPEPTGHSDEPTPDAADESAKARATAETGESDTPDNPKAPENPERVGKAEDASAADTDTRTADATDRSAKRRSSDAPVDKTRAEKRSGAEGADDRAQLASHARQRVEIHFRDRFRYPRIARQRGWEGRVVLTFRLQPDGRITDVAVTESSGRSLLDENARQTLIHIQRVPELADRLGPEPLELVVPVTYRLQPA